MPLSPSTQNVAGTPPHAFFSDRALKMTGSLDCVPVMTVIGGLAFEHRSGDLQVRTRRAVKTVHFDGGSMVFAASSSMTDRLGQRLVAEGRITQRDVDRAQAVAQKARQRFGTALVRAGLLSEEEISQQVVLQVEGIIVSLFRESDGVYIFDERECAIPEDLRAAHPTPRILLEGARAMVEGRLVLAALPPLDTIARVSRRPALVSARAELQDVEQAVLNATGEGAPLRLILSRVAGDKGKVLRACLGLLAAGHLEPVTEESPAPAVEPSARAQREAKRSRGASVGAAMSSPAAGVGPRRETEMSPHEVINEPASESSVPTPSTRADTSAAATPTDPEGSSSERELERYHRDTWDGMAIEELARDARLHVETRDWAGAVKILSKLVAQAPEVAEYHAMLATAMARTNLKRNAERHFLEAIRLDPRNASLHHALGRYYRDSKMQGRAAAAFRKALSLNPKHEAACRDLEAMDRRDSKDSMKDLFRKFLTRP